MESEAGSEGFQPIAPPLYTTDIWFSTGICKWRCEGKREKREFDTRAKKAGYAGQTESLQGKWPQTQRLHDSIT
jgi:hypothetical protein